MCGSEPAETNYTALQLDIGYNSNADSDGGEPIKPRASTPLPTKAEPILPTNSTAPAFVPDFGEVNHEATALEEYWDKKARRAARAAKRRQWDRDEAAEEGGWGTIAHGQPDRIAGGWDTVEDDVVKDDAQNVEEEQQVVGNGSGYIPPHLRSTNTTHSGASTPQGESGRKYGGLQHSFVSAGVAPKELKERDESSQERNTSRRMYVQRAPSPPREPHIDAW